MMMMMMMMMGIKKIPRHQSSRAPPEPAHFKYNYHMLIKIISLLTIGILTFVWPVSIASAQTHSMSVSVHSSRSSISANDRVSFSAHAQGNGVQKIEMYVNARVVHTCYNTSSCSYTGGPYSAYAGTSISYAAKSFDKRMNSAWSGYSYIRVSSNSQNNRNQNHDEEHDDHDDHEDHDNHDSHDHENDHDDHAGHHDHNDQEDHSNHGNHNARGSSSVPSNQNSSNHANHDDHSDHSNHNHGSSVIASPPINQPQNNNNNHAGHNHDSHAEHNHAVHQASPTQPTNTNNSNNNHTGHNHASHAPVQPSNTNNNNHAGHNHDSHAEHAQPVQAPQSAKPVNTSPQTGVNSQHAVHDGHNHDDHAGHNHAAPAQTSNTNNSTNNNNSHAGHNHVPQNSKTNLSPQVEIVNSHVHNHDDHDHTGHAHSSVKNVSNNTSQSKKAVSSQVQDHHEHDGHDHTEHNQNHKSVVVSKNTANDTHDHGGHEDHDDHGHISSQLLNFNEKVFVGKNKKIYKQNDFWLHSFKSEMFHYNGSHIIHWEKPNQDYTGFLVFWSQEEVPADLKDMVPEALPKNRLFYAPKNLKNGKFLAYVFPYIELQDGTKKMLEPGYRIERSLTNIPEVVVAEESWWEKMFWFF